MFTKALVGQSVQLVDVVSDLASIQGKSAKIRYLTALGWKRSRIASMLNIKYQHVRQVQVTPLKRRPGSSLTDRQVDMIVDMIHRSDDVMHPVDLEYLGSDDYIPTL